MKANQAAWPVRTRLSGAGSLPQWLLRMGRSRSVGTSATGWAVDGADQGDLERQPRGVRATAHPRRAAGRRRADRRQAGRAADAPRRDRGRQPQAFGKDHHARPPSGACGAGSGGSRLQCRQWRPAVGGRHHLCQDGDGIPVLGGGAGCVEPAGGGLVRWPATCAPSWC